VEAIKDHRSDFEDVRDIRITGDPNANLAILQGQMRYDVKWKGYEKKADRTWETEENLQ